ncbi:MAG: hypothetical protein KAI79_01210, partial [Bacteroidales bacterium]|nr:hypothetical protein [Bacteroidales bacterium]
NGLANIKHGTQIDYFLEKLTPLLRDKLLRKYKGIKPGDIKNKITMVVFFRDFIRAKFDGQSKEQFTSPYGKITEHLGKVDFNKWVEKIYQNKAIIDPIIEIYKIKEEFEKRKALKGLEKKVQRIDSEKYYSATKHKKYLMICEGESASGGLMPGLGSEDFGYYELKGKPLNAYDQPQQKFASNKELSELYHIIKTEGYDYIIFATDQDLDGYTIRGLLLGFFDRYLNTMLKDGKVGVLQTPIRAMIKNNKLNAWIYNLSDTMNETSGYSKYFKGIGSWKPEWLEQVIAKDGFKKMIQIWEYDDNAKESMDSWLNSKRPDDRKEMLRNNEFDLVKL